MYLVPLLSVTNVTLKICACAAGIQTRFDKSDVAEMKRILAQHSPGLSPDHGLLLETKQHLAAALGRVEVSFTLSAADRRLPQQS